MGIVVQESQDEQTRELSPMPMRVPFAVISVLTTAAVATSVVLLTTSVYGFAQASPEVRLRGVDCWVACIAAGCCAAKPWLAIVAVHSHLSKASRYAAGAVWVVLLAYNCAFVSMAIVPWRDGIDVIDLWIAASVLLLEIISGAMPAVLYDHTVEAAHDVSPAASDSPEDKDQPPPSSRMPSPPPFSSISGLLRDLEVHGPERFPMLLFNAGRLSASQRNIARALVCQSPSTVNAWLKKEKARGLIDFKVSPMLTTVWRVPGRKPSIEVRASAQAASILAPDD